ncbi:MAG: PqqD family peptide modification chaperone [Candidatus Hodarchaeota archaeon]
MKNEKKTLLSNDFQNNQFIHARKGDMGEIRLHLRREGDYGILIINASKILHLNPTATFFVERILQGKSDDLIVKELKNNYRVTKRRAYSDLQSFKTMIHTVSTTNDSCPFSAIESHDFSLPELSLSAPLRMDLALTYRCNNNCGHCYNQINSPNASEMNIDAWKSILSRIWDLSIPHVTFTGGEPTLRSDLPELIEYAENLGLVTGLITNGRNLKDSSYVEKLVSGGLDHVQITLETVEATIHNEMVGKKGAWEETVEGIKNAIDNQVYTLTNTTITKLNAQTMDKTIDFLHSLGVEQFACNSLICSGKGKKSSQGLKERELIPILQNIKAKAEKNSMRFIWYTPTRYCELNPVELGLGPKRCSASNIAMAIEPNGVVIPCQSYYNGLGHILNDSWDSIWNHSLSKNIREHNSMPKECKECVQLDICGGGCPLSFQREDYICPESKANE